MGFIKIFLFFFPPALTLLKPQEDIKYATVVGYLNAKAVEYLIAHLTSMTNKTRYNYFSFS